MRRCHSAWRCEMPFWTRAPISWVMDRKIGDMQTQRTHRQALPLSLALEDTLLDEFKG